MKTIIGALGVSLLATCALAEGALHKVAIHVNQNDPAVLNMALNNVQNLNAYYMAQGDNVEIELVAYGPGLSMFVPGKSPVADRVSTMGLEMENLKFSACGNTLAKMSAKAGTEIALMDEAHVVPSGVVRLVELQQQGYAYVRP
ncbi:DsrE family protein [Aliiruegeria sabulilitoris]|uniref:DsrE family protein n=1 Tax=Aliiruegeria sabulilitoris TaxID=1510458 RepID=UPI000834FAE1|nr:DsrE family protein [Aliiruegeria sabulilitoris]NDR57373.1 hypothetical protein [Pseudoruegeria sp. M32A2M]